MWWLSWMRTALFGLLILATCVACVRQRAASSPSASTDALVSTPVLDDATTTVTSVVATESSGVFPALPDNGSVAAWAAEIVASVPHDPEAFTQGVEIVDGVMFESTGGWGTSSLRQVDPETGDVWSLVALDDQHFGEGLTVVGDSVIQLTWLSGVAFVYDRTSLRLTDEFEYEGEGWGLCLMDDTLVMSDGSNRLYLRDPVSFELRSAVEVTPGVGKVAASIPVPIDDLNELECIDGLVIANVWKSNYLVVIDPHSGAVVARIDATEVVERAHSDASGTEINVLNGIAAAGDGTLWLTGKLWPRSYRVRIVEQTHG